MYLTKSDFKVARTCPTKLFYKKMRYPSLLDDDPYLQFLADGGYMVEHMAKLLYPDGREIGDWRDPKRAFEATRRAVEVGDVTLFEATVVHGNLLARVDILIREGNTLRLVEVKSTSVDSLADGPSPFRGRRGGLDSGWRPYLEDVTFQVAVLRRAFAGFRLAPFLCVVDKAKRATENVTFDKFSLRREKSQEARYRPAVLYSGDVERLQTEHVLAVMDVSNEVAELEAEVTTAADALAATLGEDPIRRVPPELGQKCKGCEYRLPLKDPERNGFLECWRNLAHPDPHILDLIRIDLLGGKNRDVVAELALEGKASLGDTPRGLLHGDTAVRQDIQLRYTALGKEYHDPQLKTVLSRHPYPLYFIDFEGSRLAIPYHAGMRPYEQAAFQWSCHTIREPGGKPEHTEWLNSEEAFPNFEFARALKQQIGEAGTVYIWSPYEITILREIRRQMKDYGENDPGLAAWLDSITAEDNPRIVDLLRICRSSYFHPDMKSSASIKYVLPAVWKEDRQLREHPFFTQYLKHDEHGQPRNPYATLPSLPIGEKEEVVNEGTGAMRIYQEMMFGLGSTDPALRDRYRRLLLQYCKLDTVAMLMIWMHWTGYGRSE